MMSHMRAYLPSVERQKRTTVIVRSLPISDKVPIILTYIVTLQTESLISSSFLSKQWQHKQTSILLSFHVCKQGLTLQNHSRTTPLIQRKRHWRWHTKQHYAWAGVGWAQGRAKSTWSQHGEGGAAATPRFVASTESSLWNLRRCLAQP